MDFVLLLTRMMGLALMAHGAQKVTLWFGGRGVDGTIAWMEARGLRPGRFFAVAAGLNLIFGGLLIVLGLGGPIGPMFALTAMIVAIAITAPFGFFAQDKGCETPLIYSALILLLAFTGYGAYSTDAVLKLAGVWTPALIWAALGAGILAGLAVTCVRGRYSGRPTVPSASPQNLHGRPESL